MNVSSQQSRLRRHTVESHHRKSHDQLRTARYIRLEMRPEDEGWLVDLVQLYQGLLPSTINAFEAVNGNLELRKS